MTHLVEMASLPVLTDVAVDIDGVDQCEIYPFPIPDLFVGAPLLVSGQYGGEHFPLPSPHTLHHAAGNCRAEKCKVSSFL